ncbi:hypothetical protein [Chitinophaga sp.]|uniref:hypothetical protein n=1 Tax=Chitinophaga sp. TaxID=1869181 RepID=UPI0031D75EB5
MGDNNGGGEAVVGRTTSDVAGAAVGRNDSGGYGVRSFIATSTAGSAIGVLGQVELAGNRWPFSLYLFRFPSLTRKWQYINLN